MRFAHFLGVALWVGGAISAFTIARVITTGPEGNRNILIAVLARIHGYVIGPGAVLTVLTGLLLTMSLAQSGAGDLLAHPGMVVMQSAGIVAAILAIFVAVPTANRIARLAATENVASARQIAGLRNRQAIVSSISGVLALVALFAATLTR